LGYFGSFWGHVFNLLFGHFGLYLQVTIFITCPKKCPKLGHFGPLLGYFGSFCGHVLNLLFGHFGLYLQVTLSEPVPKRGQKWVHFGPFWDILVHFGVMFLTSFLAILAFICR
jgi:hypothetical protein